MRSIPAYLREKTEPFLDLPALRYLDGNERKVVNYREFMNQVEQFARGLVKLGVEPGDRVYLLADNSPKWIVADLGILQAGGVSVPRGADTTPPESEYILRHSGATVVIAQNRKLLDTLPETGIPLSARVIIEGDHPEARSFTEVLEGGKDVELPETALELATIVYTSGTTGVPKGVMLTHENILHNMRVAPQVIGVHTTDRFLSVLPSWHMFERTVEYALFSCGATLSYSSLRTLKTDLVEESPTFLVAVPRLFEGLHDGFQAKLDQKSPLARAFAKFMIRRAKSWAKYRLTWKDRIENPRKKRGGSKLVAAIGCITAAPLGLLGRKMVGGKVQAALGGRMRGAVSGGGMMPLHLDHFLHSLGVPIIVGYGLTETSPVVSIRRFEDNVLGTIGRAVGETELRVMGPNGKEVPLGQSGELEVRGPQVMRGYYGNEEATNAVLDKEGWFKTGDLVSMTKKGDLIFTGRQKETIVLGGGENIEPYPIESRILESPFVNQVMIIGQDRKALGALIVPDAERAKAEAEARGVSIEDLIRKEVISLVTAEAGFKPREKVTRVAVVDHEFSVEDGTMTRTLKLKRNVILEKYEELIETLYK